MATMRCMSPLVALPVPLVGSKPLPSVGISAVSDPPAWGGSDGAVDGAAVICSRDRGLAVVDVALAQHCLLPVFTVVVDRDVVPGVPGLVVVVVPPSVSREVEVLSGADTEEEVPSVVGGSRPVCGFFPLLPQA